MPQYVPWKFRKFIFLIHENQGKRKIEISEFKIRARLAKIINLVEHRVAVFSKTFYLLHQRTETTLRSLLISQEVKCDCADCFIFR